MGLSVLVKGSFQDKLALAFRAFDENGDNRCDAFSSVLVRHALLSHCSSHFFSLTSQDFHR